MLELKDTKTELVAKIISSEHNKPIEKVLVVGCGKGVESAILAQQFKANVVGIDIADDFDATASQYATLIAGDATSLDFTDESFDFIYSYHALEHIGNPGLALQEMFRVLKNGGGYWVGTPNRLRILGYIGSKRATWKQKINWNLNDWKAKLTGTFRNEMGAHAGFSSNELNDLLLTVFPETREVTDAYYTQIYKKYDALLNLIRLTNLAKWIYPSIYFMGRK